MAMPTRDNPPNNPSMRPTPGIGGGPPTVGAMRPPPQGVAQTPETKGAEPVLLEGTDPVLLHRLYPEADSIEEAASSALAQGQKTRDEGAALPDPQKGPFK